MKERTGEIIGEKTCRNTEKQERERQGEVEDVGELPADFPLLLVVVHNTHRIPD